MERKMLVDDLFYRTNPKNIKEMMDDYNKDSVKTSDVKIGPKGGRYIILNETDGRGNLISKKVYLPKH